MDVGYSSELGFRVLWDRTEATGGATDATRGRLTAIVAGTVVWGLPNARAEDGVEWTWVELLEHLAEHWTALTWEELDPLGQGCLCRHLRAEAEARWQGLSSAVVETEEEALWRFEQRHDLATALQGAWPGSLWILRRGKSCLVEGGERSIVLPFASVLATLEALGERIVARLTGLADARSRAALHAWAERERSSATERTALATGISPAEWSALDPNGRRRSEQPDTSEILAVARMLGASVGASVLQRVFEAIDGTERRETAELDGLAVTIAAEAAAGARPWEQGHACAAALRQRLGADDEERVEPQRLLEGWNVAVLDRDLGAPQVEAIAIWGPRHGPAVLVNTAGRRATGTGRRRATLAHEIGHLLLDRAGALPLAEVLGGHIPADVEARANAFAAELLLPRAVAGARLAGAEDVELELRRLGREYGVSHELAAWQARNSDVPLPEERRRFLRGKVQDPHRF